ncbi:MAG: hypothetical protein ACLUI3_16835 [Christensenellales bacterium]
MRAVDRADALYAATGTAARSPDWLRAKALGVGPEITGVAVSRKDAGYEGRCASWRTRLWPGWAATRA